MVVAVNVSVQCIEGNEDESHDINLSMALAVIYA